MAMLSFIARKCGLILFYFPGWDSKARGGAAGKLSYIYIIKQKLRLYAGFNERVEEKNNFI